MSKTSRVQVFAGRSEPFIKLEYGTEIVIHWTGGPNFPNYDQVKVGRFRLDALINSFFVEFVIPAQKRLGRLFLDICGDREDKRDREIIGEFLNSAGIAMSWVKKIRPSMKLYRGAPTNFLYTRVIHPVEELYMRCLVVAVMFGDKREKREALRMICHDFVHMGGIGEDGTPASVFDNFLNWFRYSFDIFQPGQALPDAYRTFGDIVEHVSQTVSSGYPKVKEVFAGQIDNFSTSTSCGFGRRDIMSPAKEELLSRLETIVTDLRAKAA